MVSVRRTRTTGRATAGASLAVLLVVAVMASPARSADGDLDPTFSGDGRVVSDFGFDDRAAGVAVQPDGRVVLAGTSCGGDFLVARYNADGTPDGGFGTGGRVCIDVGAGSVDAGEQVLVLGDGRLLVAGTSGGDFALVRLNPSGSPDLTFGTGGRVTYDVGGTDVLQDAALAPDGKVVMVGETTRPGCATAPVDRGQTVAIAVVRALPDGAPDPTFGSNGRVVRGSEFDVQRGFAVAVQNDGAIVVAGHVASCTRVSINFLVFRLTASGLADPSFVPAAVEGDLIPSSAVDVLVQPDGKVVVAVNTFVGPAIGPQRDDAMHVVRYNPDGSADTTFDGDGLATAFFGEGLNATPSALALQGDKIVVGGSVDGNIALARFNVNGSPDATFDGDGDGDGKVVTDFGGADQLAALAVQGDGKLVAAGRTGTDVALARYGTATSTPTPTPLAPACAILRDIRATFAADPFLRPFTGLIDSLAAVFGCPRL